VHRCSELHIFLQVPLSVIGGHSKAVSYVRFMGGSHVVSASTDDTLKLWDVSRATLNGNLRPDRTFRGENCRLARRLGWLVCTAQQLPMSQGPLIRCSLVQSAAIRISICYAQIRLPQHLSASSSQRAGHSNAKNFVGCSVTADGYIATGSEDNALYCYHRSMPTPVTRHCFDEAAAAAGAQHHHGSAAGQGGDAGSFVGGGAAAAAAAHYRDNENPDANQFLSSVAWCRRGGSCIASNSQGHIKVLQLST